MASHSGFSGYVQGDVCLLDDLSIARSSAFNFCTPKHLSFGFLRTRKLLNVEPFVLCLPHSCVYVTEPVTTGALGDWASDRGGAPVRRRSKHRTARKHGRRAMQAQCTFSGTH